MHVMDTQRTLARSLNPTTPRRASAHRSFWKAARGLDSLAPRECLRNGEDPLLHVLLKKNLQWPPNGLADVASPFLHSSSLSVFHPKLSFKSHRKCRLPQEGHPVLSFSAASPLSPQCSSCPKNVFLGHLSSFEVLIYLSICLVFNQKSLKLRTQLSLSLYSHLWSLAQDKYSVNVR